VRGGSLLLWPLSSPTTVGDVRGGLGLLSAGMITPVWDVLHLAPPLVTTRDERDRTIQIVDECLTELEAELVDDITD
jgi:adenosylmethionine-8-amino-7-oxononanoate aminotransferase